MNTSFDTTILLLNGLHEQVAMTDEHDIIQINDERNFLLPEGYNAVVAHVGDVNSQIITFDIPKTYDGHNLHECGFKQITWKNLSDNISGVSNLSKITREVDGENREFFEWLIPPQIAQTSGIIELSISCYDLDSSNKIAFAWNTSKNRSLVIGESQTFLGTKNDSIQLPPKNQILLVHDNKQIIAPKEYNNLIGLYGDKSTGKIYFKCKQNIAGIDLLHEKTNIKVLVNFEDATYSNDDIQINTIETNSEFVLLTWSIPDWVTANENEYIGTIKVGLVFTAGDKCWRSASYSSLRIGESLVKDSDQAVSAPTLEEEVTKIVNDVIENKEVATKEYVDDKLSEVGGSIELSQTLTIEEGETGEDKAPSVKAVNDGFRALGYVTPDMFGAVGNGVTDDTEAFQQCFDASEGKTIIIPCKSYCLKSAIKLRKEIFSYDIRGLAYEPYPYGTEFGEVTKKENIICDTHFLDGSSEEGYVQHFSIHMQDLNVKFAYDPNEKNKNFLHNISVMSASILNCTTENATAFLRGGLRGRSLVSNCKCFGLQRAFMEDGDAASWETLYGTHDSVISNCYINGNPRVNPSIFIVSTLSATVVKDCYFDFFKEGFSRPYTFGVSSINCVNTKFIGCVFEIMWRVIATPFDGKTPMFFEGCQFHLISEQSVKTYFEAPDTEMLRDGVYTKCGVLVNDMQNMDIIEKKQNYLRNVRFVNNFFTDVDYPIYMSPLAWDHSNIKEYGSVFANAKENIVFNIVATDDVIDTFYFESLQDKDYDTLPVIPVPNTAGQRYPVTWFEGMRIFYNGKPAILRNKQWIDYAGNVLN